MGVIEEEIQRLRGHNDHRGALVENQEVYVTRIDDGGSGHFALLTFIHDGQTNGDEIAVTLDATDGRVAISTLPDEAGRASVVHLNYNSFLEVAEAIGYIAGMVADLVEEESFVEANVAALGWKRSVPDGEAIR